MHAGNYTHYKGGKYLVLFTADDSTNERDGQKTVVYVSLSQMRVYCRNLEEFIESVQWPDGKMRPRFARD